LNQSHVQLKIRTVLVTIKEEENTIRYHLVTHPGHLRELINLVRAQIIQDRQENMSDIRSERKRIKELKVLELHDKGFSSRQIASIVHMSLRDVIEYIQRISNKRKSPSMTSTHDEIVLEYTVNLLRSEVRDLRIERDYLKNEVNDLREQKYNLMNQVRAKKVELGTLKRDLQTEKFFNEILKDISTEGQITT